MHEIKANWKRFHGICKEVFNGVTDQKGNLQF